jgi:4,5-dihydroxyphthalate decarboxylase
MSGALALSTLLGSTPFAAPLKNGALRPSLFTFAFADIATAQNGFKALVRDGAYDIAECAIVTLLQAKAYGKPLVLLPFVVNGLFHDYALQQQLIPQRLQVDDLFNETTATLGAA